MWGKDLLALNMKGGVPVIEGAKMLRHQADELTEAGGMIGVLREKVSLQADYITQLEKGLESSIAMNKAQAERFAELERKHKEEFNYAEKLLKERDK